ncbi:hypothetical protein [Eubacterium callanderi]|uniref:hypothetical protein n=1 Tax=Eubacterium callanderi TaxID=53442 RepID=UPI001C0F81ED|nr:hypothetical protein [Eubacterium callanderi]MBU5302652.1 hypothetical protein [Eubacterium callanderi]WPK69702.1 hypothetical protein EUCA2A_38920 [Eubacterium callanderi]WPK74000.1 hypothetical protein EUCA11A_38920 [Eubacterium callanderi]
MLKHKKKNTWDFSDNGDFKKHLLEQMKSIYHTELSDSEMENIVGGASKAGGTDEDLRCAYWVDDSSGKYLGCTNCQNRSCKDF